MRLFRWFCVLGAERRASKARWREIAKSLPGQAQCAAVLGIGVPDYVRGWRTWWRWRIACKLHDLTFDNIWAYSDHWNAAHVVNGLTTAR